MRKNALILISLLSLLTCGCSKEPPKKLPYEGNLYSAKAYSHHTQEEYNVQVKFEKKNVTVYFSDQPFYAMRNRPPVSISRGGFWEMQLDSEAIDDPSNIRLIDNKSNLFLYINITDPSFPKTK